MGGEKARVVGRNYLHAFAPNVRSCESRRRRHVARVVHDSGALGWIRTVSTPNAEHQTPNAVRTSTAINQSKIALVVDFLSRRLRLAFLPKAQSRGHRC